ncbi:hypothetical protein BV372_21970 [Nostoc sp. T09]|uniref:hypothetical protein n=1 Tax=Nostoc sp. T09 TaxID=1932621 RepID=UPI000A372210|nr:hypothetical protein [Nostoc sp. T09]OUL30437.1 hypothetical protein BV372_21970 [Nostoc sp. T09]
MNFYTLQIPADTGINDILGNGATTAKSIAALPNAPVPLQLAAFRISEARLQIYRICELEDKECNVN